MLLSAIPIKDALAQLLTQRKRHAIHLLQSTEFSFELFSLVLNVLRDTLSVVYTQLPRIASSEIPKGISGISQNPVYRYLPDYIQEYSPLFERQELKPELIDQAASAWISQIVESIKKEVELKKIDQISAVISVRSVVQKEAEETDQVLAKVFIYLI